MSGSNWRAKARWISGSHELCYYQLVFTSSFQKNCFTRWLLLAGGHVSFIEDVLSLISEHLTVPQMTYSGNEFSVWFQTSDRGQQACLYWLWLSRRHSCKRTTRAGGWSFQVYTFCRWERETALLWLKYGWASIHNGSDWFCKKIFLMASPLPHIFWQKYPWIFESFSTLGQHTWVHTQDKFILVWRRGS